MGDFWSCCHKSDLYVDLDHTRYMATTTWGELLYSDYIQLVEVATGNNWIIVNCILHLHGKLHAIEKSCLGFALLYGLAMVLYNNVL